MGSKQSFLNILLYSEDISSAKEHLVVLLWSVCTLSDPHCIILALKKDLLLLCETVLWGLVEVARFSGEIRLCYT